MEDGHKGVVRQPVLILIKNDYETVNNVIYKGILPNWR